MPKRISAIVCSAHSWLLAVLKCTSFLPKIHAILVLPALRQDFPVVAFVLADSILHTCCNLIGYVYFTVHAAVTADAAWDGGFRKVAHRKLDDSLSPPTHVDDVLQSVAAGFRHSLNHTLIQIYQRILTLGAPTVFRPFH